MKSNRVIATAIVAAVMSVTALTEASALEQFDGNKLNQFCQGDSIGAKIGCVSYIAGVADALREIRFTCPPSGVTNGQLMEIGKQSLARHPELLHNGAGVLVAGALRQAFPCR